MRRYICILPSLSLISRTLVRVVTVILDHFHFLTKCIKNVVFHHDVKPDQVSLQVALNDTPHIFFPAIVKFYPSSHMSFQTLNRKPSLSLCDDHTFPETLVERPYIHILSPPCPLPRFPPHPLRMPRHLWRPWRNVQA
ncbi:hypothetical protein TNIN_445851 [Trichonephila inaurata madagascariensis]|uniref:Uncharacterized protein n=1 Tax=Trichonephila inaurata madagascariensis TaxID=2747483 RepID=A0A8X7C4L3_9ARAC|nr:hypothetical protein TNIN_445851 [Trichonephila inaurata madagascariensis]